jgi:hypothetical protein
MANGAGISAMFVRARERPSARHYFCVNPVSDNTQLDNLVKKLWYELDYGDLD